MPSYYNNYLLEKGILKDDYTLSTSEYEKVRINEEYNKLYSNSYDENQKNAQLKENKKIFHLSFMELVRNGSRVYMEIINSVSVYINSPNRDINQLGYIFTKGENILYIGILTIALSFFLWLIDISK
jgi:hypothetical protein